MVGAGDRTARGVAVGDGVGEGVRIGGAAVGRGVGVGRGAGEGPITRGALRAGPSTSTGPSASGVGVELSPGGS